MTSRMPFLRLLKEDMKGRTLSIVLSIIVEFLLFPVATVFILQNMSGDIESLTRTFTGYLSSGIRGGVIAVAMVGAVICANAGFGYLFNKKSVDLYHSLPVNRRISFAVRYINGVLVYLVPLLVFSGISVCIYAAYLRIDAALMIELGKLLAIGILSFLLIYNIFIMGIMLAGNALNAHFVSVFIGTYVILIGELLEGYMSMFFHNYLAGEQALWLSLQKYSPFVYVANMSNLDSWLLSIILISVTLLISYILYIGRRMEIAGQGVSFKPVRIIIRLAVTILSGLGFALMFGAGGQPVTAWLVFGVIFGSFVAHLLINSMFNMTIKGALKDISFLAIAMLLGISTTLSIRYDCFGYDNYIPDEASVKAISMQIRAYERANILPDTAMRKTYNKTVDESDLSQLVSMNAGYFGEKFMEAVDIEKNPRIYDLAILAKNEAMLSRAKNSDQYEEAVPYSEAAVTEEYINGEQVDYIDYDNGIGLTIKIKYILKNGHTIYREYDMDRTETVSRMIEEVVESQEYKDAFVRTHTLGDTDSLKYAYVSHYAATGDDSGSLYGADSSKGIAFKDKYVVVLDKEMSRKLYEAYKQDISEMDINNMLYDDETHGLTLVYEEGGKTTVCNPVIYESNIRTLQLLHDAGVGIGISAINDAKSVSYIYMLHAYGVADIDLKLTDSKDIEEFVSLAAKQYEGIEHIAKNGNYIFEIRYADGRTNEKGIVRGSELERWVINRLQQK